MPDWSSCHVSSWHGALKTISGPICSPWRARCWGGCTKAATRMAIGQKAIQQPLCAIFLCTGLRMRTSRAIPWCSLLWKLVRKSAGLWGSCTNLTCGSAEMWRRKLQTTAQWPWSGIKKLLPRPSRRTRHCSPTCRKATASTIFSTSCTWILPCQQHHCFLNPLNHSVQISEDYVGRISRMSRRTSPQQVITRVLERSLQATYKHWREQGFIREWSSELEKMLHRACTVHVDHYSLIGPDSSPNMAV